MKTKGSPIFKLCKKSLSHFIEKLWWISSNGKDINFWKDSILGKLPPRLPRLQSWMEARALSTLWSISDWEVIYPHRWISWVMSDCPDALETDKLKLLNHLAGIALISLSRKDRRGWGNRIGIYTTAEGYNVYAASYNVPTNPVIWNYNWTTKRCPKLMCSLGH